ncbi:MAG: group II intron maturase-specific domain-containing protein [Evtepia sp.]
MRTTKSLKKAKEKLKLLTKRNRGRNVRAVMREVKVFIRGWLGYFHVADMKRIDAESWDEWLRRRFRMYIWKQWKKPQTKSGQFKKAGDPGGQGVPVGKFQTEATGELPEALCLKCSITNERLAAAGYFSILGCYESLHLYG